MILKSSIVDYASRLEETEKRNADVPQWMLHDGSVDGFMIDTRFVPDRMDYETMAWTEKDVRRDHYAEPALEYHSGTLVEAMRMHLRARIDIIQAVLGQDGFKKFCRGNALKYLIRADRKNGLEDLKKAAVYLSWEINGREAEDDGEGKTADAEAAEEENLQNEEREAGKSAEKGLPLEEETCGRAEETPEKEVQELPAENVPAEEEPEAAVSGSTGTGDKQADIHRKAEALAEQHFQRQKTRKGRPVSWDVDKAKELWTSGSSPEEVCDAVGITTAAFSSYRFRHPDVFPDHEV